MEDKEILAMLRRAFADARRPVHFTNYTHCEECAEHDAVLRSRTLDSLTRADVGNVGWDPICFVSPAGFSYYFPALVRLALGVTEPPHDPYLVQLLFALRLDGRGDERRQHCTPTQRLAVADFLRHLIDTRAEVLDNYGMAEDALSALDAWSATSVPHAAEPNASGDSRG